MVLTNQLLGNRELNKRKQRSRVAWRWEDLAEGLACRAACCPPVAEAALNIPGNPGENPALLNELLLLVLTQARC